MEGQQLDQTELLGCDKCGKSGSACICGEPEQANPDLLEAAEIAAESNGEAQDNSDKTVQISHPRLDLSGDSPGSDSELVPFDPWIGKTIKDQYEIVSLIARGGMGAVYRARHILLGTDRAIKVIRPDLHRDDVVYQRFKQEAQAVEGLSHPNIISFYDYGVFEFAPYVVMDLVEGQSLDVVIKSQGKLELTQALNIFVQVAGALEHAHSKGILHRDIKSSNIMLVKDDFGQQSPMLLDFGIAKIQSADGQQKITSTGEIFGSPAYMSPEQGKGQATDARSDIYSLGCVLYESLAGKPPFEGRNAIETIMQHLNAPVPKIPVTSKMADDPVYRDFEAIIMRCLEKDPENRYASMADLHEDLKRLSYGERLLKLQEEIANRKRAGLFGRIYKYALIAFAIGIVPYAVFSVFIDPSSWRKDLASALEDQDNADKIIQEIMMTRLNVKDEMYNWNKAYLLYSQAQVYRQKSADNHQLIAFSIECYKQAFKLLDKFAAEKTSHPLLAKQLRSNCLAGLTRAYLKQIEWETPEGLERKVAEAKKTPEPDFKSSGGSNEVVSALASAKELVKLREALIGSRGANSENEIPYAHALGLEARAVLPFKNYSYIDDLLGKQEDILHDFLPKSWAHIDCLLNRSQIKELRNHRTAALKMLQTAKDMEAELYGSEKDPFVLNIQNNIDRLEKSLKDNPETDPEALADAAESATDGGSESGSEAKRKTK